MRQIALVLLIAQHPPGRLVVRVVADRLQGQRVGQRRLVAVDRPLGQGVEGVRLIAPQLEETLMPLDHLGRGVRRAISAARPAAARSARRACTDRADPGRRGSASPRPPSPSCSHQAASFSKSRDVLGPQLLRFPIEVFRRRPRRQCRRPRQPQSRPAAKKTATVRKLLRSILGRAWCFMVAARFPLMPRLCQPCGNGRGVPKHG